MDGLSKGWRFWKHFVDVARKHKSTKPKIEFEGFKYTLHPDDTLKFARNMSLRQKTKGGDFTASLITEVLHLRDTLRRLHERAK